MCISFLNPFPVLYLRVKYVRYNRNFLLQFLSPCKAKPPSLSLDMIGLELLDPSSLKFFRGPGTFSFAIPPARQASIGLGFSSSTLGKGTAGSFSQIGNFATPGGSKLNSEDRFATSNRAVSVTGDTARSGPGRERTRSKRSEK